MDKLDQLTNIHETIQFMSQQYGDILKGWPMMLKRKKFLNDARVKNDCIVSGLRLGDNATAVDSVVEK